MFMCSGQLFSHGRQRQVLADAGAAALGPNVVLELVRGNGACVVSTGLGAVWPSPHSDMSRIIRPSSSSVGQVLLAPLALGDAREDAQRLVQPDAAGHALAAGFRVGEFDEVAGDVDHAVVFVHHHHAARAHDGAELAQRLVIDRRVEHVLRNAAARRPAGLHRLDRMAVQAAAADVVDEVARAACPSGISTRPVFLTLPTSEKTLVPELLALPVSVNHAGPLAMIGAMLNQVSTLLILVG